MLTHNGKHKHGDLRLNTIGMLVIEIFAQSIMNTERKSGRTSPLIVDTSLALTLVVSFKISKKLQFDVIQLWMLE